jgi:hypothetical protein
LYSHVAHFSPQIDVSYGADDGLYRGLMISQGRSYSVQGPDKGAVLRDLEYKLEEEYLGLLRSLDIDHRTLHGVADALSQGVSRTMTPGHDPLEELFAASVGVSSALGALCPFPIGMLDALHLLTHLAGHAFGRRTVGMRGARGIPKARMFSAVVGGTVVTAGSPKDLKRKLVKERVKHIQKIMQAVEIHRKERESAVKRLRPQPKCASEARRLGEALRAHAEPQGGLSSPWEARLQSHKMRLADKRGAMRDLYEGR